MKFGMRDARKHSKHQAKPALMDLLVESLKSLRISSAEFPVSNLALAVRRWLPAI
jgi:hypothetical protein